MQPLAFPINGEDEAANWAPQKFRYWYDHIIDLLLAQPELSQKEIAQKLNRHAATIGMIMNSDLFRARYEQRKGAQSQALQDKLNGKLTKVAIEALEITEEVLKAKRHTVPLQDLGDIADKALARLGYGPKGNPAVAAVNLQVNGMVVAPVSPEQLAASRAKLIEHQNQISREDEKRTPARGLSAGTEDVDV